MLPEEIPVTEQTLPSIIEGEIAKSIGNFDGDLSSSRAEEFKYYYGKPFGNEVEGESQVVSTDVADAVEGMLPIILNIFAASDDVVRFDPNGPEDEEQAAQQSEVANYVFYRQNNGFLVLYEWFKDALIQKNGIVKYWWDEKTTRTKETYKGLTEGEYRMLMSDTTYIEVEEIEKTVYDDPSAVQAKEAMQEKIAMAPPEIQVQLQAQLDNQPVPQLYDCTLRITKDVSQIRIQAIPPEEFGISAAHNCVSIQDTPFCYHRTRKSISALREMGVPEDIIQGLAPANEPDISPEALARDRYIDDTWRVTGQVKGEPEVWVTDCFIRVDFDGDGIAELRHIIMPGRTVWVNEECDHINFACITPIIMPHRWIGRSISELVMDIQFTKSTLWRQQLNNLYLTNNPQKAVLSSAGGIVQANLDDLMTSRPGGILREYVPNAIRHIETPFVAGASFGMIEYMDAVKENRTGITRYNQGTDSDSLNKTARGIAMIQTAGAQRTNLIARIFAETGVKDLMRGIVYMLSKYSQKAMTLKLRNKWVDIDPREWKTQFNMTVNVGLGTGNRDVQLAHLNTVHQQQMALMQEGRGYMVTDENIWNVMKKSQEAMGFKHPELFITDPQSVDPRAKQPRPDPAAMKVQADAQEGQAKLQFSAQKEQMTAAMEKYLGELQAKTAIAVAEINAMKDKEISAMKIKADAELIVFDKTHTLKDEAAKLENKAKDVQMAEQALAVKTDIEERVVGHREEIATSIAQQNEERIVQREQAIVDTMTASVTQAMGQVAVQIGALQPFLAQIAALSQQTVQELQKPKAVSISGVKTDSKGVITGANIATRPVNG